MYVYVIETTKCKKKKKKYHVYSLIASTFSFTFLCQFLARESSVYKERPRWGPETDRLWVRQRDPHDKKSTDALLYPVLCG